MKWFYEKQIQKGETMNKIWVILIIIVFLSGCASYTKILRDEEGRIKEVKSKGNVETHVKEGTTEWKQSTKQEPFFKLPDINLNKVGN